MARRKKNQPDANGGVIIANPMYDVVFKKLMMDKDIACYYIGTILGEKITDINLLQHEYPYIKKVKKTDNEQEKTEEFRLVRLDFVATIRTKGDEHKKILIEIQRTENPLDVLRFRTYLGEQYKIENTITVKDGKIEDSLPIVVIYMLGFELPDVNSIAVKANRQYVDLIDKGNIIECKNHFIECLTHDGYFIQIPRIDGNTYKEWEKCSELKQMLSLFEQDYFVDETFLKKYPYPITHPIIKKMVETLAFIAADPDIRRAMQEEYWAEQNELFC